MVKSKYQDLGCIGWIIYIFIFFGSVALIDYGLIRTLIVLFLIYPVFWFSKYIIVEGVFEDILDKDKSEDAKKRKRMGLIFILIMIAAWSAIITMVVKDLQEFVFIN